jgi:ABC-type bacteriocin/lantibiotic exporter with double-glycine peptidase domain
MAKTLLDKPFPRMKRVAQRTDSHCGPAVLQMLYSFLGEHIDQHKFVVATGAEKKLDEYGMTVFELEKASNLLAPEYKFWYKDHGTAEELSYIVNNKGFPVGVEWQGRFLEYADDVAFPDNGHYAVVVAINIPENKITIADPFEPFAHKDRKFYLDKFLKRWWDINEVVNPATGEVTHLADDQMMFIVVPKDETFPQKLSMKSLE